MGTIAEVTAIETPIATPAPTPESHESLLQRLEDAFKALGKDISAEVAAIRAKL